MRRAFTLIELLVVIAIIAILAAILFPVFAQAKVAAKSAANLSNLKQNALAVLQYANDYDDAFPLAIEEGSLAEQLMVYPTPVNGTQLTTSLPGIIPWQEEVYPYTKNREIYTSPLASSPSGAGTVLQYEQSQFYGVVPRASSLAYSTNGAFELVEPWLNNGVGAFIDGPFGAYADAYAVANNTATVYNVPSLTQTAIQNISDVVMISDAGQFDDGFTTSLTSPNTNESTTTASSFIPVTPSPWANNLAYVGPWARKGTSGSWNGGTNNAYTAGQTGLISYAATDGSAHTVAFGNMYQLNTSGQTTPVAYRLWVNSTP